MKSIFFLFWFLHLVLMAESTDLKIKDMPSQGDTSIVIKKGATTTDCTEYEIVEGKEDIAGDPAFAKNIAHQGWKDACKEWKNSMREMNKGNPIISLNCNQAMMDKDGDSLVYKSIGTYKIKVKMKEKKE